MYLIKVIHNDYAYLEYELEYDYGFCSIEFDYCIKKFHDQSNEYFSFSFYLDKHSRNEHNLNFSKKLLSYIENYKIYVFD